MEPALVVALLMLLFGGTHIGLGTRPIRRPLVARLGETGFTAAFYLDASSSFAALVAYYAAHRFEGAPGLASADAPALRWPLMIVIAAGLTLAGSMLVSYPRLPSALFSPPIEPPNGIARITRHPFFVGFGLFALAHALLARHLVGTVIFGGFALLALIGAAHQDRKLLSGYGGVMGLNASCQEPGCPSGQCKRCEPSSGGSCGGCRRKQCEEQCSQCDPADGQCKLGCAHFDSSQGTCVSGCYGCQYCDTTQNACVSSCGDGCYCDPATNSCQSDTGRPCDICNYQGTGQVLHLCPGWCCVINGSNVPACCIVPCIQCCPAFGDLYTCLETPCSQCQ